MSNRIKTSDLLAAKIPIEDLLPSSLLDIMHSIGLPATLKLIEHYGGIRLFVPVKLVPDHVLIGQIGADATIILINIYAGESIEIPRADKALKYLRAEDMLSSGLSQRTLALRYNFTIRGVRKAQKRARQLIDDLQEDLF